MRIWDRGGAGGGTDWKLSLPNHAWAGTPCISLEDMLILVIPFVGIYIYIYMPVVCGRRTKGWGPWSSRCSLSDTGVDEDSPGTGVYEDYHLWHTSAWRDTQMRKHRKKQTQSQTHRDTANSKSVFQRRDEVGLMLRGLLLVSALTLR